MVVSVLVSSDCKWSLTMEKPDTEIGGLNTCFHVGITGHRDIAPGELPRVQAQLWEVLKAIKATVSLLHQEQKKVSPQFAVGTDPTLRLISPLAEGADRLAARAALELGYELQCPLPFDKEYFKTTFSGGEASCDEFDELLGKASAVLEIAIGNRRNTSQAYADVAAVLIDHSDVLIALSDGTPSKLIAGTYATVRQAFRQNVPVIVIPCARTGRDARQCYAENDILFFGDLHSYAQEVVGGEWKMQLVDHLKRVLLLENEYSKELPYLLPRKVPPPVLAASSPDDAAMPQSHLAWVEYKNYYSSVAGKAASWFRRGLLCKQISPVFAYFCLALALHCNAVFAGFPDIHQIAFLLQVAFLIIPILIYVREIFARNHRLFLRTRMLAELCRVSIFLAPTGYCNVRYRPRAYRKNSNYDTLSWVFRSLARCTGLPSGYLTRQGCRAWLSNLSTDFVNKQLEYHDKRYNCDQVRLKWFSRIALVCFGISVFCAILRALLPDDYVGEYTGLISGLCLVSPALAVLFSSLSAYLNLSANASASRAMGSSLEVIKAETMDLERKIDLSFSDILPLCESVDALCRDEVSDWVDYTSPKVMKLT